MDAKDLKEAIDCCEHCDDWGDFVFNIKYVKSKENLLEKPLGKELFDLGYKIEKEDSYGGEGQGDKFWVVFSVEKDSEKTFFRLDGWYSSYGGATFDSPLSFYVVKKVPVECHEWHEI